jgi:tetratricopeptide (TPR) repeat protein
MNKDWRPIIAVGLLIVTVLIGLVTNLLTSSLPSGWQSITSPAVLIPFLVILIFVGVVLVVLQLKAESNKPTNNSNLVLASTSHNSLPSSTIEISQPIYDVFISHSHHTQEWVENILLPMLERNNIKVFVPYRDAAIGVSKVKDIEQAIRNSRHTLLVITPEYLKDSWANLENMIAQFIDPSSRERRLIPIIKEHCELPLNLRAINVLDLTAKNIDDTDWQKLIEAIQPINPDKEIQTLVSSPQVTQTLDDAINNVKRFVIDTKYSDAKREAEKYYDAVLKKGDPVLLSRLEVWYSHAIMYLGKTNEAKAVLGSVISRCENLHLDGAQMANVHYILGRAHNNLGYLLWIDLGQYKNALTEFDQAIRYFLLCNQVNDVATVCDNLGRVYAQLGYGTHAELLIEHGKTLRQDSSDQYRLALSLDSLANAYIASGQPNRALYRSQQAFSLFRKHYDETFTGVRGLGLALLTKGKAERFLGSLAYTGNDRAGKYATNERHLSEAIQTLKKAGTYFKQVDEKIRLFQVNNELACIYRERSEIYKLLGRGDESLEQLLKANDASNDSLHYIEHDDVANDIKYRLHYIDACEDMARAWTVAGFPVTENGQSDADKWLQKAIEQIPPEYQLDNTLESEVGTELKKEIDEFWHQMGKIYALKGETLFEKDTPKSIEYYILATACFGIFRENNSSFPSHDIGAYHGDPAMMYAPQLASHRIFLSKLFQSLKQLKGEKLLDIYNKSVPKVAEKYSLKDHWLHDFNEILRILLRVTAA